jgi:hypothetical protein
MTFPVQLLSQFTQPAYQASYTITNTPTLSAEFEVPDGVFTLSAVVIGGGGGGSGGGTGGGGRSGGGGGGGVTWSVFTVQPGDILTVNIGSSGEGGTLNANGTNGGTSSVILKSRDGVDINEMIIFANGGGGGSKGVGSGGGGTGIQPDLGTPSNFERIYIGGGNGGDGGTVTNTEGNVGAGGGGAGGYSGNGGVGGSISGGVTPTAADADSGGGGGGGYETGGIGWGGGGVGAFGFDGTSEGVAGINNSSGGGGGSYFNDPFYPIAAQFVGSASTDQTFISYSAVKDNAGNPATLATNDFLVLLSAADSSVPGAPLQISVPNSLEFPPVGFTTIVRTNNGEYQAKSDDLTDIRYIPDTTASNDKLEVAYSPGPDATLDINFSSSFAYIPSGGLTSATLPNLDANCIHNLVCLRFIPGTTETPAEFRWRNTSGDPGLNPTRGALTLMPDPPLVPGVPGGAVSIISGYLANCVLNPGTTAGDNSFSLGSATGGLGGVVGQGVGIAAQYTLSEYQINGATVGDREVVSTTLSAGTTVDPDLFLTGTSAHSRCYTLELRRTAPATQITLVGTAITASYYTNPIARTGFRAGVAGTTGAGFQLPADTQAGDLIVLVAAKDNPQAAAAPIYGGGGNFTVWRTDITADEGTGNGNRFQNDSEDPRGTGGLGFFVGYIFATGPGGTVDLDIGGVTASTPGAVHIAVFRNATPVTTGTNTYRIWDNRTTDPFNPGDVDATAYGAPDPGSIVTSAANSAVISYALIDNIGISNISTIQPPPGYISLAQTSYGAPNDGAVVMSAYKTGLTAGDENPGNFIGDGGNIWASQTLIIGGPGGETSGVSANGGFWGGGGGGANRDGTNGGNGAAGAVRLLWGSGRQYPLIDYGTGNVSIGITSWIT